MLRQVKLGVRSLELRAKKSFYLALLSAVLLSLSFSSFNLWFLAWVGFVPLFWGLEGKSPRKAFLLATLTGFIFWLCTIYWLVHVTLPGTIVLCLYLSLYFGIFGLLFPYLLSTTYYLLSFPALWVLLEYARSRLLTGFPWALLAHSQYRVPPIIQVADIGGAWVVSFIVMLVNMSIFRAITCHTQIGMRLVSRGHVKSRIASKIWLTIPLCFVFSCLAYGFSRLHFPLPTNYHLLPTPEYGLKVSVIQGNIPQELKWDERAKRFILNRYAQLTREAAGQTPDLIIWPEASSPGLIPDDTALTRELLALSEEVKTPILIGTVTNEGDAYFNSALLAAGGEFAGRYDKLHLVPFGEYIPLKKFLPFLETIVPIGDINRGNRYQMFSLTTNYQLLPTINFAILICFEDLFPELSRKFVQEGAQFLTVITNDAWYKRTSAAFQHLSASVFRAVENRVYVLRAANTGVSGFIQPSGRFSALAGKDGSEIFVTGQMTETINIESYHPTVYNRWGDFFVAICAIFSVILRPRRGRRISN